VVALDQGVGCALLSFDAAPETLRKTTLGTLVAEDRVNLERSMRSGDRIHGHFVSGHVDARVALLDRSPDGNSIMLTWELPEALRPYVATKGSIALAGVSLTVGEVTEKTFGVYIIPHTADVTTLASKTVGQAVNVEIDMLARYVKTILSVHV
jgi:riboflavin synthase